MKSYSERDYRPIRDFALIGDGYTAALVARDGSIDWCCWPSFDSPAIFCRLLDAHRGGWCRVGPTGPYTVTRSYLGATNVLAATFTTDRGQVRVTDLMPIRQPGTRADPRVLRHIEGLAGEVELEVSFRPSFDFARAATSVTPYPGGAAAYGGHESVALVCPIPLQPDAWGAVSGRTQVTGGRRFWITLTYQQGQPGPAAFQATDADAELDRTLDYWQEWSAACTYTGPYHDLVRRSALTLKLLTFEPTGALVAAPTASLPEEVGGVRNWDYRYTWLRDAALTLYALQTLGYHQEAMHFFDWLEALCLCCRGDLQAVYTVAGSPDLPEQPLDHLEGYRRSRPVRVGNAAAGQTQLDVYGHALDAAYYCFREMPRPVSPELWAVLRYMADRAALRWREPDQGIWEMRAAPRHFLYSKLLCWVALDRAIRLAGQARLPGDRDGWRRAREEIRRAILAEGYDAKVGAFTQAFGVSALDASALAVPLVGFLPATYPRVLSTMDRVRERLTAHGLVYRYLADDGLPGRDATFALCSFWLVDNLTLAGRVGEARALFERVAGYANDLGLLAEEIDPASGELLGNFPQGFTHLALIRSALHIAKAEALGPERHAETAVERAQQREHAWP